MTPVPRVFAPLLRSACTVIAVASFATAPPLAGADDQAAADPLGAPAAFSEKAPDPGFAPVGRITWSDGRDLAGHLRLDKDLEVHDAKTLRTIPRAQVRAIRLLPESEAMQRAFRFTTPGQVAKELTGDPYPVRHLTAEVDLVDGSSISGHLYTTVVYLTPAGEDRPQRVILLAKQQGAPGTTLAALAYPTRIIPTPPAGAPPSTAKTLTFPAKTLAPGDQVVLIARDGLARTETAPGTTPDQLTLPVPVAPPAFLARLRGKTLTVAWPAGDDAALHALVATAVHDAQDFLDDRRLLAITNEADQVYALLLLYRSGATTDGPNHPWRLEIWRWHRDDDRLLWAGRAWFFRDRVDGLEQLPTVSLEPAWWSQQREEGGIVVGAGLPVKAAP